MMLSDMLEAIKALKDTKPIMGLIKADAKRLFNHYLKTELNQETQKNT